MAESGRKWQHILILATVLVVFGVIMRLVPHPWNTTPLVGIGLFGYYHMSQRFAWLLPLLVLAVSDVFLGWYDWKLLLVVYACFATVTLFGSWIKKNRKHKTISTIKAAVAASVFFYLITNFAVWVFSPWYPPTFAGLMESYTLALPFFRNMLLGDIAFTLGIFAAYEFVVFQILPRPRPKLLSYFSHYLSHLFSKKIS